MYNHFFVLTYVFVICSFVSFSLRCDIFVRIIRYNYILIFLQKAVWKEKDGDFHRVVDSGQYMMATNHMWTRTHNSKKSHTAACDEIVRNGRKLPILHITIIFNYSRTYNSASSFLEVTINRMLIFVSFVFVLITESYKEAILKIPKFFFLTVSFNLR